MLKLSPLFPISKGAFSPYSFPQYLWKTWGKTIELSEFTFLPHGCQKNINMLFLDFTCYHGNHFVESTLTKIIKITKLCNFYSHCICSYLLSYDFCRYASMGVQKLTHSNSIVLWRHTDVIKCQICEILGFWSHYLYKKEINQKMITVFTF